MDLIYARRIRCRSSVHQDTLFYRLGNIGIRSYIKRRLPVLVTGSRRHDDNRCLLRLRSAAQSLDHFIAIELRHLKIGDDQPIILGGRLTETFFSVHRRIDFIPSRLQHPAHKLSDAQGVVDQEKQLR